MTDLTHSDCLNYGDDCDGPVEYRMPLSSTGKSFPRCEHHWDERLRDQQEINRKCFSIPPTDEELEDERFENRIERAEYDRQ